MNNLKELSTKIHLERKKQHPKDVDVKMTTIRPCNRVAILVELLAYLNDQTASEYIYDVFGDALAKFLVKSKQHIPAVEKVIAKLEEEGAVEKHFKDESAIDYLNRAKVISEDNPYIGKDPLFTDEVKKKLLNSKWLFEGYDNE